MSFFKPSSISSPFPCTPQRSAVPPKLEKEAEIADTFAHPVRLISDLLSRREIDAVANADGSWMISFGTYESRLNGPSSKAKDVATYQVSADGNLVTELRPSEAAVLLLPENIKATVRKADAKHLRNVADVSSGRIFDAKQQANGSWTVKVGTFKSELTGATSNKASDVVTYTIRADGVLLKTVGPR